MSNEAATTDEVSVALKGRSRPSGPSIWPVHLARPSGSNGAASWNERVM